MTEPSIDAHVRLDTHPTHSSAVTATLTGTQHVLARSVLTAHRFEALDDRTLVMTRIDSEEPYWAEKAAQALAAEGISTEITPRLRVAIDEAWSWTTYYTPSADREEVRVTSNDAQKIHDDIRHGRLLIHAHAKGSHTAHAVGTYLDSGRGIQLHGEGHQRQVSETFDSPAQALVSFERLHGDSVRPGPAPMTDTERETTQALTSLGAPTRTPEPATPEPETVPAYAADPGDHDALLYEFLAAHSDWEKWRTWSDDTTHAIHESQTLRIERLHETHPRETSWTVAAYETPVSERMWHLTATGATPAPMIRNLLYDLAEGKGWDTTVGGAIDEATVTAATKPLTDAGWEHTVDGRWIRWMSLTREAGVLFDAFAALQPNSTLATWTLWAGPSLDHSTWSLAASPHTPSSLLADLTENLAQGTGTRQPTTPARHRRTTSPTRRAIPAPTTEHAASRAR